MLKSTPLGRNEGPKRDIEYHDAGKGEGQLFESYLPVKHMITNGRSSVFYQRNQKMYRAFHNPSS